jgi:parallel beta-helix repeat protein
MKIKSLLPFIFLSTASLFLSCSSGDSSETEESNGEKEKALQEELILAEDGAVIELGEGTYTFNRSLSIEGKNNITIIGTGMDKTILDFAGQVDGAEGIRVTNCTNIVLEGFAVHNSSGDGIKAQDCTDVSFRKLRIDWTNGISTENGAYGLYPVSCKGVIIEDCEAYHASDAGLYVGQSNNNIIRNNYVSENVAGIEVENCFDSEVYDNVCENNTLGVLVYDLPNLPQSNGARTIVYNNQLLNNNLENFAPPGNIVGMVPAGVGLVIMSTREAEVFNNEIAGHKTVGLAVASYDLTLRPYDDPNFNPHISAIYVHDNQFRDGIADADGSKELGLLLKTMFPDTPMDIIYDGTINPAALNEDGSIVSGKEICFQNNGEVNFANVNLPEMFSDIKRDISPYDCSISLNSIYDLEPISTALPD